MTDRPRSRGTMERTDAVHSFDRPSPDRYRMVLETAADAIITIDERGIIDSVNPAAVRMFGWSRPSWRAGRSRI